MSFDEVERREFDQRYNLILNIQYGIRLYQNFLLEEKMKNPELEKITNDYKDLLLLEARITTFDLVTLNRIYHDLSIKVRGIINA